LKILVAGRDGQVGQALVRTANKRGLELVALSRQELDITNASDVELAIAQHNPDVVINAAAYTAVDKAEEDREQAHSINTLGPELLAKACDAVSIPFLHVSTDFVFDGEKESAYLETDTCNPLGVYGASKLAGEIAVSQLCLRHIILRTSWVFGGEQNFVNTMRRLAKDRDQLNVVDDQRGGPTAATQIAEALLIIAEKVVNPVFDNWGIYHFSGAPAVSWYEFACEILKDVPSVTVTPIPTSQYPTPAKRPANSVLDCKKIETAFSIKQPSWKVALTQ